MNFFKNKMIEAEQICPLNLLNNFPTKTTLNFNYYSHKIVKIAISIVKSYGFTIEIHTNVVTKIKINENRK